MRKLVKPQWSLVGHVILETRSDWIVLCCSKPTPREACNGKSLLKLDGPRMVPVKAVL